MRTAVTQRAGAVIPALLLLWFIGSATQAYANWDYGDGRHGTRVLTENTTIEQLYQSVRLPTDPVQYDPSDPRAVPNFRNLTIANNGNNFTTLTANSWNGSTGGRIVFKVQGVLTVTAEATISVDTRGYPDGSATYNNFGVLENGGGPGGGGGGAAKANPNGTGTIIYIGGGGGGYGSTGANAAQSPIAGFGLGGGVYGTPTLETFYLVIEEKLAAGA